MKINWIVRMKNPVFVTTFATTVIAFIYTLLGVFGVVPSVSESAVIQGLTLVVEMLTAIGILADPTTKGASDSTRAMTYREPH